MEVNSTQQATNRTMRLVNEHLEGVGGTGYNNNTLNIFSPTTGYNNDSLNIFSQSTGYNNNTLNNFTEDACDDKTCLGWNIK
ncbi:unnamed protein product [Adineta steineri]|uniref:Uncharacterized protein n=1 Tax=Adineta steineri TaxID=433720 RepID=A0A814XA92_9BILA|nr:unnamed protein product [Adineta steineri]CAF4039344.1 unnamed protein product [Adineta steineri]